MQSQTTKQGPFFITLEGGEGAGKSTQATRLVAKLEASGHRAIATREPGGSPHAEALRTILLSGQVADLGATAEAVLFSAARIDHIDTLIRPKLQQGLSVVCDRFADSTRAYQGVLGNLDARLIHALEVITVGNTVPHLTLMLDVPADVGLARAAQRRQGTADRFEGEDMSFHQALRNCFLDIAAKEPQRCVVIDAGQGVESVSDAIWTAVTTRLLTPTLSKS